MGPERRKASRGAYGAVLGLLALSLTWLSAPSAVAKTAYQFLQESPKPRFRSGYTLPRLSRWGWTMSYDTRVELCENWGYALEFGGYATQSTVNNLNNPSSIESRICALTASNPQRYPLFVLLHRPFLYSSFVDALPESTWCHDAAGNRIVTDQWKLYSPIMPDSNYQDAGTQGAAPLARILQACPISIILNGGEYGLSVYGHSGLVWGADPAVVAAKGTRSWYDFISDRKAHYEQFVTDATVAQVPGLDLYLYYYTDGAPHRMAYGSWWQWVWDYACMRTISTVPNSSIYYLEFNTGWTGDRDMLTEALNSAAYQTSFGDRLSYNWVCGGYKAGEFSDDAHYMGFLKNWYTAGMIGGIAGYFSYPTGGFTGDVGATIPSWLMQMMTLGRVHALFSQFEDFQRNGDLLPGPNMHKWSTDLPAYEFPTGDADARVLARKHRDRSEWLICAWAAGGADRQVSATVPGLGTVNVLARACGTVYRAKPGPVLTLIDADGMLPTAAIHAITATSGPNGTIFSSGNVIVPTGADEPFTFTPDAGFAIAGVVVDGVGVGTPSQYTFAGVTADHTISVTFAEQTHHTGDYWPASGVPGPTNRQFDFVIDFHELLRVIQLYNAGALHTDAASEDGYATGSGAHGAPHSSDYWPASGTPGPANRAQDWVIDFHELLRFMQLYNAGAYRVDPTTEDGFAPGAAPGGTATER
jgi:hypothetical protein